MIEQVTKDADKQRAKLASLQRDLEVVKQAADDKARYEREKEEYEVGCPAVSFKRLTDLCALQSGKAASGSGEEAEDDEETSLIFPSPLVTPCCSRYSSCTVTFIAHPPYSQSTLHRPSRLICRTDLVSFASSFSLSLCVTTAGARTRLSHS